MKRVLICGGGGFIGGAMAIRLKAEGYFVRVADIKEHEFLDMRNLVDEVLVGDLCDSIFADEVCAGGVDELYQFAADMGARAIFSLARTTQMSCITPPKLTSTWLRWL